MAGGEIKVIGRQYGLGRRSDGSPGPSSKDRSDRITFGRRAATWLCNTRLNRIPATVDFNLMLTLERPHSTEFSCKYSLFVNIDRLCQLVVRVSDYRSRGPGSIPGATTLSEK
jgi:hypothetical protein